MNLASRNDSLEVISVRRGRLGEGAPQAWTGRSEGELEDVVDGVEDQTLQSRLENGERISALWKHVRLVLPLCESSDVHPVPI